MQKKQKRILLTMAWYDHRVCQGVAKYAEAAGWHFCADLANDRVVPWGWEGDGILAWLGADDELVEFVVQAHLPTVDFSFRRPQLPFPRVLGDHNAAAQLVAEHFLVRGLKNFMFFSGGENWSFDEVGRAFVRRIRASGYDCPWIRWHKSREFAAGHIRWKDRLGWLAAQLKQAPKPLGLFAATDSHAQEVIEACEGARLAVPEQVSLVGMDNSLLAVDSMRTPISSVDRNLERIGYRGAELLGRLMQGKAPPKEPVRVPPKELIVRKSSDLLAVNHSGVARSLHFLWKNYHEPIGVEDLVRVAAMSRSALHQAFWEHIGRPPGKELQRVRIEQAKKLLAQSPIKLEAVAEMCGYQSATSFCMAFKHTTGMTPTQFKNAS